MPDRILKNIFIEKKIKLVHKLMLAYFNVSLFLVNSLGDFDFQIEDKRRYYSARKGIYLIASAYCDAEDRDRMIGKYSSSLKEANIYKPELFGGFA